MRARWLVFGVLAAVFGGCASTGSAAGGRGDRNLLDREEIEASVQSNAYDLIRVHRPGWLRIRGIKSIESETPISVYLDGIRYGDPESLRNIPTLTVEDIRFYGAADAQLKFGLNNVNGVIAIRSRRG